MSLSSSQYRALPPSVGFVNRYRKSDGTYRALEWNVVTADGVMYFVAHITNQRAEREQLRTQDALRVFNIGQSSTACSYTSIAAENRLRR